MTDMNALITMAGGDEKVARACNISLDAIRKWREAGRVPSKNWEKLAKMAGEPLHVVAAARAMRRNQSKKAA